MQNLVFSRRRGERTQYYARTKDRTATCKAVLLLAACKHFNIPTNSIRHTWGYMRSYMQYASCVNSVSFTTNSVAHNKPAHEPHFTYKHSTQHNAYYVKAYKKYNVTQQQFINAACAKWGFTQAQIASVTQHIKNDSYVEGYKITLHSNTLF